MSCGVRESGVGGGGHISFLYLLPLLGSCQSGSVAGEDGGRAFLLFLLEGEEEEGREN